jgi:D-aminopeptidase
VARARDFGITIGTGRPGPYNAITDVAGVRVGHRTIIEGEGALRPGEGPVRTGVTVVLPHGESVGENAVFAGCHRLNGNGELTGLEWVRESGLLTSPIGLTNTHSVGVVRDALVRAEYEGRDPGSLFWSLPVVGETWDGALNDINGFHVTPEHLRDALRDASGGPVTEGSVGGGTGMVCHGFKGGIGTASRVVAEAEGGWTVGVLVQANHGRRDRFTVNGAPVGRVLTDAVLPVPRMPRTTPAVVEGGGSIIAVVATDAPLLPHQLHRIAQRPGLGIARLGSAADHSSGDLFFAFSTAHRIQAADYGAAPAMIQPVAMLSDAYITPLFHAVVEATEEAVVNALVAADTMTGRDGVTAHALDGDRLAGILARWTPPEPD